MAGKIVFEGMGSWCVDNTESMFEVRDDVQIRVRQRLELGMPVIPEVFTRELLESVEAV